jgi:hypothetical protein
MGKIIYCYQNNIIPYILDAYESYNCIYGMNYSGELHINYEISQLLYVNFENKFMDLINDLKLNMYCLKNHFGSIYINIENINENYIKIIFDYIIDNITNTYNWIDNYKVEL